MYRHAKRGAKTATIVRAYSCVGIYPDDSVKLRTAAFQVSDSLVWSITKCAIDPIAERLWLTPEEVRLLASITLAFDPAPAALKVIHLAAAKVIHPGRECSRG
jgi:hypothetical protein